MEQQRQHMYALPPPPVFGVVPTDASGVPTNASQAGISLDDIFDEFWANDDGDGYPNAYARQGHSGMGPQSSQRQQSIDSQDSDEASHKKKKRTREASRSMTEEQKVERR
jgi:hypothetical protein